MAAPLSGVLPDGISETDLHSRTSSKRLTQNPNDLFKVALINSRSVCNKSHEVNEFIQDHSLDACTITETWLQGDSRDNHVIADLLPPRYKIEHSARGSRGGGVALVVREHLVVTTLRNNPRNYSFECQETIIHTEPSLRMIILYRPPSAAPFKQFLEEFSIYLEHLMVTSGKLLIAGDFNIHVDDPASSEGREFLGLLDTFDLHQHVQGPTHENRHCLDLALSRKKIDNEDDLVYSCFVQDCCLSDHFAVFLNRSEACNQLLRKK